MNGTSLLQDIQWKKSNKKVVFQRLISDFSDNPLKLHKISCRGPPNQRNMSSIFRKKRKISVFGVNGTSFLQVIQRKQRNQIVKKKKKGVKKKGRKKKRQKSALPSSDSSTFYLSWPVPTDLTIASVVSVLGYIDRLTPMPRTLFRKDGWCLKVKWLQG